MKWSIKNRCRVYIAFKMGGLTPNQINQKSEGAKAVCIRYGLFPISPWDKEKSHYIGEDWDKPIHASKKILTLVTPQDKQEIEDAYVVIDLDGDKWSKGTAIETGFNRYGLMRPTVYVDNQDYNSLRTVEGDYIARDLWDACSLIQKKWGTRIKRVIWRLRTVYNPHSIKTRIRRFFKSWR